MSMHLYMGWGLFALQVAKVGDELLPFVGKRYSKIEFNSMCNTDPRLKNYVLRPEKTRLSRWQCSKMKYCRNHKQLYWEGRIANVLWEYVSLPTPWDPTNWGYVMTVATRDIEKGDELFTYYPLN